MPGLPPDVPNPNEFGLGTYIETGLVRGKGLAGGTDTYHAAPGGPYVFSETGLAKGKGLAGGVDEAGLPGSVIEENGLVIGKGMPGELRSGGPIVFEDIGRVLGKGLPTSLERQGSLEWGDAIGVGQPGGSDTFPQSDARTYFEFPIATAKGLAGGSSQLITLDTRGSVAKGQAGGSSQLITDDVGLSIGKGQAGGPAFSVYFATGLAAAEGLAAGSHVVVFDNLGVVGGEGLSGGSSQLITDDRGTSAGKGQASGAVDAFVFTEVGPSVAKVLAAGANQHITADAGQALSEGLAGGDGSHVALDLAVAAGEGVASQADTKGYVEVGLASGRGQAAGSSQLITSDGDGAIGVGQPNPLYRSIDTQGLIPACRYHAKAVFPTIARMPEGMPNLSVGNQLTLPVLCIVATRSSRRDGAVMDEEQTVGVDFVLLEADAAGTDNVQSQRARLRDLELRLLEDPQLFGRSETPSSYGLQIVEAPFDRSNAYVRHFFENGQKVSVTVLAIEAWTVTNEE